MMAENAGGIYYDIEMDVRGLLTAQQQVNARLDSMEKGFNNTGRAVASTERSMSSLSRVASALSAVLSVQQVSRYADAWTTVNNKLSNAIRPNEQLAEVTERVFNITQETRASLDATASLYARLERATRQYNTSANDLSKLTTIINQGFIVSGATAQEAENAVIQLSQGLASGALRGEEFNSVNEQGNRLIVALADSLGVGVGELRNMAAQGKLTTDVVVNGLLSQGNQIGAEFAKTTTTIGQALQVAGNNITKFFGENATVKSGVSAFNSAIVSASENIDALSFALAAVSVSMGSRFASALTISTAAKIKSTMASIQQASADRQLAKDELGAAAAVQRRTVVEKEAAIAERDRALSTLASLKATNASTVAEVAHADAELVSIRTNLQQIQAEKALEIQRAKAQITEQGRIATATRMAQLRQAESVLTQQLSRAEAAAQNARAVAYATASAQISAANSTVITTTAAATAANGALSASQSRLSATSITLASALRTVNSALSPLGGVAGIVMIIAAGWYLYAQNQAQARQESIAFADTLPDVIKKLKEMNLAQAQGIRADTIDSIKAQKEAIADKESAIESISADYEKYTSLARQYGVTEDENNGYVIKAREAANQLAKARRDLDGQTSTLRQTEESLRLVNIQVNQGIVDQMRAARDNAIALAEAEKKTSLLGGSQALLAEKLGISTQALEKFNAESLKINWGGSDGEKLIKQAERRLALSKLEGKAQAELQATYDAEDAKITDPLAIDRLKAVYAETEAVKGQKKATKESNEEGKKSASQAESIAQKLAALKQQSELAAGSTQELSREQAMLRAGQSLGKSASAEQIQQARDYAAAIWDAAKAVKNRQQAEQGQHFAKQEIAASQESVDPNTGVAINPVAKIDYEEQQKLAALAKYQEIDKQNTQLYEDAKTAIQSQASNQRRRISEQEADSQRENMSQLLGASSNFFGEMAGLVGDYAGESSAAYKTLFAISKGFAITQATMNLVTAISNAAALPWPANIPAIAAAAAQGANLISQVRSINYSGGRKNGGGVKAGNLYEYGEGNLPELLQIGGKSFMLPGNNGRVISNKDLMDSAGQPQIQKASTGSEYLKSNANGNSSDGSYGDSRQIQVNIQFIDQASGGGRSLDSQAVQDGDVLTVTAFLTDLDGGGPMSTGIRDTFGLSRKANGDL